MSTRIRLRYDSIQNWSVINPAPTLLPGEFGVARHPDGTITVRVGNGENNTPVNWGDAEEISGAGTVIDGFDFTNLEVGDIIYWDGANGWNTSSLADRLEAGTNIQLIEDPVTRKVKINYFVASFNPTINYNKIIEVRNLYNNQASSSTNPGGLGSSLTFTINNGGNLDIASGNVTSVTPKNYSQSGTLFSEITGAGTYNIPFSSIDNDGQFGAIIGASGFKLSDINTRRDRLNVNTTSEIVPPLTSGNTDTDTLILKYGWRTFFVWSQTDYSDASTLQNDYNSNSSLFTKTNDDIIEDPSIEITVTTTSPSTPTGNWYLYYMHSCNGASTADTFGFTPVFRASNGDIETFTEITSIPIPYDTTQISAVNPVKQYKVWKFSNPFEQGSPVTFRIDSA